MVSCVGQHLPGPYCLRGLGQEETISSGYGVLPVELGMLISGPGDNVFSTTMTLWQAFKVKSQTRPSMGTEQKGIDRGSPSS